MDLSIANKEQREAFRNFVERVPLPDLGRSEAKWSRWLSKLVGQYIADNFPELDMDGTVAMSRELYPIGASVLAF